MVLIGLNEYKINIIKQKSGVWWRASEVEITSSWSRIRTRVIKTHWQIHYHHHHRSQEFQFKTPAKNKNYFPFVIGGVTETDPAMIHRGSFPTKEI